jgi:hypothetical protein
MDGSVAPWSIGWSVSTGLLPMLHEQTIVPFDRIAHGTPVTVL